MAVPFNFATQSGNILLSELDANFANVSAHAATATYVTGNNQSNITGVGTLNSLAVYGNITGGNITVNGAVRANVVTGVTYTGTNVSVTGKVTSSSITASGNIVGGTLSTTGNVVANIVNSTALNVTGNTVLGNLTVTGTLVAGDINVNSIVNGTSNVDITNTNGNVTVGVNGTNNVLVVTSTGANITGTLNSTGNTVSGNLSSTNMSLGGNLNVAGTMSLTGNMLGNVNVSGVITGGYLATARGVLAVGPIETESDISLGGNLYAYGTITGASLVTNAISTDDSTFVNIHDGLNVTGDITATGNITGGNLTTIGQVNNTGLEIVGVNYANITANAATSNLSTTISTNILIANNTGYTHTVNMPTSPVNGQVTRFTISGNTVTLLAGTGNITPTFAGSTTAGTGYKYVYRNSNGTWYRTI